MGGLMNFFDLKRSRMARKVADKRHGGGLEAPRNSVELPVETFQSFLSVQDDMPYNYQATEDWSKKNRYPTEAPMKKLISEEISKRPNTRQNGPSIVARLMGLDMLPLDTKPVSHQVEKHNEKPGTSSPKEKHTKNSSLDHVPLSSKSMHINEYKDPYQWRCRMKSEKPTRRFHPQEEELQKFKKEFEAWQLERLKECSKVLTSDDHTLKASPLYRGDSLDKHEHFPAEKKDSVSLRGKMVIKDTDRSPLVIPDKNLSVSLGPTRIVILRPGPDCTVNNEESWASSSGTSEERANMGDFLDEVKTRLKYELQEKTYKSESVSKNLLRSESTRSRRSEIQYDEAASPEFISMDTRRFFSDRLRNVLKEETNRDVVVISHNRSRSSMVDNERVKLGSKSQYIQSRSFRYGPDDDVIVLHKELPPKNLIRSLSAPASGTSFGKLLLEDRHFLTGAQIRRKHEVVERVTVKVKKEKKEKLGHNLREKVSSFKYSFTLRGRLFGRKFRLAEEPLCKKLDDAVKDMMSGPTVMMNFDDRYENSTEVPPSPASVCSSVHDELWRSADYLSPTTTSDVPPLENARSHGFNEISSNLNDPQMQLNHLESRDSEDSIIKERASEIEMVELKEEDQAKTYIRDLLVASGLYDGSSFTNSITNKNFEEVEIFYRTKNKNNVGPPNDHKLLFDLSNEALSTVLGPPLKGGDTMLRLPRGRKLLDCVWETTCMYLYPPADKSYQSLDGLIGRDLKSLPWSGLMSDNIDALGEEIECRILGDMIEEMVKEMRLS